jgi:predicted DNA-binding transcriptional regulator YafY
MSQNKNALIRYKTIDKCLQNSYRQWTLEDLIDACSDALEEYEGRDVNVSKRSIQLDIQLMRSDKLGYNAPIVVYDKKYYRYEDESYSITNIPITETDMNVLSETVEMLKQFKDFSLFSELDGIIQRLEDKVYTEKTKKSAIIHLDKNENLKGLEHLDTLYQAILKEICLTITYQSFKARDASEVPFHPFILKQFNNRWFVIGRKVANEPILTFALDRILNISYNLDIPYLDEAFNGDEYYKNTIGVTVLNDKQLQEVELRLDKRNAPYALTKPLHRSQEVLEHLSDGGVIIKIKVHLNFELDRLILGFGDSIEVLKPRKLKKRIKMILINAAKPYD